MKKILLEVATGAVDLAAVAVGNLAGSLLGAPPLFDGANGVAVETTLGTVGTSTGVSVTKFLRGFVYVIEIKKNCIFYIVTRYF